MKIKNFFLATLVVATSALIGACIACAEPIPQEELMVVRSQVYTMNRAMSGVDAPETMEAAMKDRPTVFTKANSDRLLAYVGNSPADPLAGVGLTTDPSSEKAGGRTRITYRAGITTLEKDGKQVIVKAVPSLANNTLWDASAGLNSTLVQSVGSELPPRRLMPPKLWESVRDATSYAPIWDLWDESKHNIPQMEKAYSAHAALPEVSQGTIVMTVQALPFGYSEFDARIGKGWSKKALLSISMPTRNPGQLGKETDPEVSFSRVIALLVGIHAQRYSVPGMDDRCDFWVQKAQAEDFSVGVLHVMPMSYKPLIEAFQRAGYKIDRTVMVPVETFDYYTF